MEKQNINETKNIKSYLKSISKIFIIIALIIAVSSVFFVFSLREVYMNDTADKSFKDHKEEYEKLKGD